MKWIGLVAALLVMVLACKSPPPPEPELPPLKPLKVNPIPVNPIPVWQRVDDSPVNPKELARDKAICDATDEGWSACSGFMCIAQRERDRERHRRAFAGCMAEHGWIFAPVEAE